MSSKKVVAASVVVMVLALLAASCGPTATPAPPTPTPEEAAPVKGGHLTIAFMTVSDDTGDLHRSWSTHSNFMSSYALDTLIEIDETDSTLHPGLAESWEFSDDVLELTLHLRKDVKFHDGTPFNAEAVKYNLDRIATLPEAKGQMSYSMLGVEEFYDKSEVLDDYTVKIVMKKPYGQILDVLATNWVGGIHSPTAIEEYGDAYGTEALVGTGAFKFVKWTGPQGELVFVRNEEYNWAPSFYDHQGPPYLESVTWKGMFDESSRTVALESGAVDMATVKRVDMARFDEMPDYKIMHGPFGGTGWGWCFNPKSPIVKDIRVRQAISHAVDREGMLKSPYFSDIGSVSLAPLTAYTWGDMEEFREHNLMYDLDKAKALLEEVGWRDTDGDGIREAHGVEGVEDGTKLRLVVEVLAEMPEFSEILQGMMPKAGIELELRVHDYDTWAANLFAGEFDVARWNQSSPGILQAFQAMWYSDAASNFMYYSNPKVDELFDAAIAAHDVEKQREFLAEAQKIILQEVAYIPMVDPWYPWAMKKEVQGVRLHPSGIGVDCYDCRISPSP